MNKSLENLITLYHAYKKARKAYLEGKDTTGKEYGAYQSAEARLKEGLFVNADKIVEYLEDKRK